MKIYYWSPHISHVATVSAVLGSIKSIQKFANSKFQCVLIDAIGEWNDYSKEIENHNIKIKKIYKNEVYSKLPRFGFIKSRIAYLIIFFSSFISLKKLLKKDQPNFLIIHLITSLPIILNFFFSFDTKIILRISGYPKLNFIRLFIWKFFGKKIYKVFCPTTETKNYLIKKKIFDEKKIFVLKDPIINIKQTIKKKNELLNFDKKKYLLTVGRITQQKNYFFLVDCFNELKKHYPNYSLVIIGDGEDKKKLINYINSKNLKNEISVLGFQNNVLNFMKNAECFILSSLWEDPGWVLIEAASVNKIIISSDCPNGPVEFLSYGKGGYLYKSNNLKSFMEKFSEYQKDKSKIKMKKMILTKRKVKEYTYFRHYKNLVENLST